ncbi:DUF58 domain-containing protein [Halogeometricum borinquense]|uniref:DUF58 domain-containing protein n=1 Tax=Halogeometricum borinquense TaxID=60847 RepID=A0A6C0UEP7_9EURY|nr:DUF58 domain-containing protein [Halogeometricum borinquense]QIB73855.1 DUF58 domain-containing protein [Halogeometricum borinquense]QIQ76783.1 DUF58 domain-containing protein [Halogeometricum borinquense]
MTIEPDFFAELERFEASLQRISEDVQQGEQESRSVGEGLTFSDYRRYAPGDDTRLIDWRVYARTEEYYVKQFEEERNLTVHVLVDTSASMDYGDGDAHKFEFGAKIGLGFAYLTAEENNDFRFSTFRNRPKRLDTGRSNRGDLLRVVDLLNETKLSDKADLVSALEEYASTIHSRSLVVVVSDFLTDPDEVESAVAALEENDVILVQTLAPDELDPDVTGDTIFEDPESGDSLRSYFGGSMANKYHDRLQSHVEAISERATTHRADHILVNTGAAFFDAFADVWVE